jgi:hypothetical protein
VFSPRSVPQKSRDWVVKLSCLEASARSRVAEMSTHHVRQAMRMTLAASGFDQRSGGCRSRRFEWLTRAGLIQLLLDFAAAFTARTDAAMLKLPLLVEQTIMVELHLLLINRARSWRR